ncbi:ankyrin repeat domain-containing protein [Legionella dresdenensis]|uniref:Ankyrin repeat domain-containing protein n=1 Tax=Legionella dresdenensis TaxID=450200 RepID=A0ABV8CCH7_9GAMM
MPKQGDEIEINLDDEVTAPIPINSYLGMPIEIKLLIFEKYLSQANTVKELFKAALAFRLLNKEHNQLALSQPALSFFAQRLKHFSNSITFQDDINEIAFEAVKNQSIFLLNLAASCGANVNQYIIYDSKIPVEKQHKLVAKNYFSANSYPGASDFIVEDGKVNRENNRAFTLLHFAVKQGWQEGIESLIAHGADLNALTLIKTYGAIGTYGRCVSIGDVWEKFDNAVHVALDNDHFDLAPGLIAKGCQVENSATLSPLAQAVRDNKPEAIALLFGFHTEMARKKAMRYALGQQNLPAIKLLIELGVKANSQLEDGNTLLHINYSNNDIIDYLVHAGANLTAENNQQETPLHLALKYNAIQGALSIIEQLASNPGADITGRNPLHYACNIDKPSDYLTVLEAFTQKFDCSYLLESMDNNHQLPIRTAWNKKNFAAFINFLELGSKTKSPLLASEYNHLLREILQNAPPVKYNHFILALIDKGATINTKSIRSEFSQALQNQHHNQTMMDKIRAHIDYLEKSFPGHPLTAAKIAIFKDLNDFIACHQSEAADKLLVNWLASKPYNVFEILGQHRRQSRFNYGYTSSIKLLFAFAHNDKSYVNRLCGIQASGRKSFKQTVIDYAHSQNLVIPTYTTQHIILNDPDIKLLLSKDILSKKMALSLSKEQLAILKTNKIKNLLCESLLKIESAVTLTNEQIARLCQKQVIHLFKSKSITAEYFLQLTLNQQNRLLEENISNLIINKSIKPREAIDLSPQQAQALNNFYVFALIYYNYFGWKELVEMDDMHVGYAAKYEIYDLLTSKILTLNDFKQLSPIQLDYLISDKILPMIKDKKITWQQALDNQKQVYSPGFFNKKESSNTNTDHLKINFESPTKQPGS